MTEPQPRFGAGPSGFIPDQGGPPPRNLPLKIGLRHRLRPELTFTIDGWFLTPKMWREIARALRRKAGDAADPEQLGDAIASIERFLAARRLYGEGPRPWR